VGNVGKTSVITFYVDTSSPPPADTTNPVVTISSPTNGATYNTRQINVIFTATDLNLNTCYYNLNGAANVIISCTTSFTITVAEGANTLIIYARDNAGNVGSRTVTFNVNTSSGGTGGQGGKTGKNIGSKQISNPYEAEQYLSQFEPKTTVQEEEILSGIEQPRLLSQTLWIWLLVLGILIFITALIILWIRR
jgi:hypothetical protein